MSKLVNFSILIPALPILSALLIGVLLICFNRTMNRLTKPVSFLIINSAAVSTLYSLILLYKHASGKIIIQPLRFFKLDYPVILNLNNSSEICISLTAFIALIAMTISFLKLPRTKGYVRYLVSFSSLLGLILLFLLSDTFLSVMHF